MRSTRQRLHLLLSSPPDAIPVGVTTAKRELDRVIEMPVWDLEIPKPDILFRADMTTPLPDQITLVREYQAVLGDSLRFGLWADTTMAKHIASYVILARKFRALCEETETSDPSLLLSTFRPEPFNGFDLVMPIALGALSQAVPEDTRIYLSSPDTDRYRLVTSQMDIEAVGRNGVELVRGETALSANPSPRASSLFLAPWWGDK